MLSLPRSFQVWLKHPQNLTEWFFAHAKHDSAIIIWHIRNM
jgi:hypothetical protein